MNREQLTGTGASVGEALLNCLHQLPEAKTAFPTAARTGVFQVDGLVQAERLVERGLNGRNPFRVGIGFGGNWDRIEALWGSDQLTAGHMSELFLADVVLEDIVGNDMERWGFPGNDYTITFTPGDAA
ncbi:hypothetical protein [Kitasatospora sp. NPDC056531]|uniref:hypothetical protein n=1 Tax=Kitasatospora sp. NPDC056531 TaxID=3345856 RepID=UPI0036B77584